ncbi:MAG: hypothetical protein RIS76_1369 [Verrucomicrobiota bacterium]
MEGKEEGGATLGQLECGAQQLGDGRLGDGAEAFEETAMAVEDRTLEFRQSQDDMTVGNRQQDVIDQMGGGLKNFALMAGGTEPPPFAGEGEQVFVRAVVAAVACESPFQGAALEEFLEDFRENGAKGAELGFIGIGIPIDEGGVVALDALPDGRFARVAGAVGFHARLPQPEADGSNRQWSTQR